VVRINAAGRPTPAYHTTDQALNSFLTSLHPRGDSEDPKVLRLALACSRDLRFREFLERLYHPRYARWSLAAIATSCDLTLGEFRQFWQKALVDRAIEIAQLSSRAIVAGMVRQAMPRDVVCDRCVGRAWVVDEKDLPAELIPGYLRHLPDGRPIRTCATAMARARSSSPVTLRPRESCSKSPGTFGKRAAVQVATYDFRRDVARTISVSVDVD